MKSFHRGRTPTGFDNLGYRTSKRRSLVARRAQLTLQAALGGRVNYYFQQESASPTITGYWLIKVKSYQYSNPVLVLTAQQFILEKWPNIQAR
jgi:hypothetical protein